MRYFQPFLLLFGLDAAFGTETQPVQYDTIVIGLGAAGTIAATDLANAGRRVLALEAQDRIGGRVCSVPFGNGVVELGAEWLHGTVHHIAYDLALENNITVTVQDLSKQNFYMSDGSVPNVDFLNDVFGYYYDEVMDAHPEIHQSMAQYGINKVKEYITQKYPEVAKDTTYVDQVIDLIGLGISSYEGGEWDDVSVWGAFEEIDGPQHASYGKKGYSTFFDILLKKHNNGPGLPTLETKLNTEVTKITWPRDDTGLVTVTTKNGDTYTANNVIVTVSIEVLKQSYTSLFSPELPIEKINAIRNISMGVIGKIHFAFDERWWPKDVLAFAFLWTAEDRKQVGDDWSSRIYGASTSEGSDNVVTLWTGVETTSTIERLPLEEVRTKGLALLRRFMGRNITIPEPTGMLRTQWASNPYTLGTYSYDNLLTGSYRNSRGGLACPLADSTGAPRVLFAGEATELTHYSTVHGALDSGRREAARLLKA